MDSREALKELEFLRVISTEAGEECPAVDEAVEKIRAALASKADEIAELMQTIDTLRKAGQDAICRETRANADKNALKARLPQQAERCGQCVDGMVVDYPDEAGDGGGHWKCTECDGTGFKQAESAEPVDAANSLFNLANRIVRGEHPVLERAHVPGIRAAAVFLRCQSMTIPQPAESAEPVTSVSGHNCPAVIYLLDMGPNESLCWCDDAAPGQDMDVKDAVKYLRADAVYTAPQPAVPEGWKLVPIEPTKRQVYAAEFPIDSVISCRQSSQHAIARAAYKAMLAAAPQAPEQPAEQWISCEERLPTESESWRWLVWAIRKGCKKAEIVERGEVGPENFTCWMTPNPKAPAPPAKQEGE